MNDAGGDGGAAAAADVVFCFAFGFHTAGRRLATTAYAKLCRQMPKPPNNDALLTVYVCLDC